MSSYTLNRVNFLILTNKQTYTTTIHNTKINATNKQPQLLLGFGINNAVSGRGIETSYGTEAWWRGPDGSTILFIFLKNWYCNGLDMPAGTVTESYWERKKSELQRAGAATSHLLLMNGCDHTAPDPNVGKAIAGTKHSGSVRIVHSNMDDYIELVQREIKRYVVYVWYT